MGTEDTQVIEKMGQSRETLRQLIAQWNANRLDLFEISEPNEDGEFHGVMRFYFQEAGAKVATKCIRVASSATAKAVIETLVEKFRPDMRMLSIPQYALYEIHENGEERRLEDPERPLLVQLNWHSDDREGRFLLRRIDEKVPYDFSMNKIQDIPVDNNFKRKLSKREKKQLKKLQEKTKTAEASSVAEKLYTELPETSFTRSISNPEAVMRRRRQQKLEKKLAQFRSRDGGPDTGGTLKIYGESLCRDVPYKTLLLSVNDNAAYVVKEMLAKYGLTDHDPLNYCLVQVCDGEGESILDEDESPLSILMNQPSSRGSIMFHVRRRPSDFHPRKRKKKPGRRAEEEKGSGYRGSYDGQLEPLMIEILPDGSETGRRISLELEVTEVGSDWGGYQLGGLRQRHCIIAHTDGIVTLTPASRDADIYLNGQRIYDTTILQHGTIVRFGRTHYFRFSQIGRTFSEREVVGPGRLSYHQDVGGMGEVRGDNLSQSPPMSPTQEENPMQRTIRPDSILPATLELPEVGEEKFLGAVIINVNPISLQFKLAPTYALYLAARYRATTHFRPEVTPHERAHLLSTFLLRVSHILMQVVQERKSDANTLAFWMANSSELLHFLKSDRQIGAFSLDAQDVLAEVVQLAFRQLVSCIQVELDNLVGHFLMERDDDDEGATSPTMGVLTSGMTLLRRCRVNAALTIQLFSQLFHFVNMAIFNTLIGMEGRNYCSRTWGRRLRRRLNRIETWADKQGLELAAECHLVRAVQATHLLQTPKNSVEEVNTVASSCFKLNSLQLRCLLMKYQFEPDEIPISPEVLDNVVRVAESTVDEVIRADGRHVRVEEEPLIGLVFLLPEDGYSCDIVRGVPSGLIEFLSPLLPVCRLTPNPSALGYWTIFFQDQMRSPSAMSGRSVATSYNNNPNTISFAQLNLNNSSGPPPQQLQQQQLSQNVSGMGMNSNPVNNSVSGGSASTPIRTGQEIEVQTIELHKMSTGLGLSIVAAKGTGQERLGIYIKSVVKGGSADMDGRLAAGDQLVSVDGQSLVGITQEKAAEYLVRTGPVVTLEVAKQAALFQGLATMLSQPSPVMSRGGFNAPRRMSERDLPSKILREQNQDITDGSLHALHSHSHLQPRIQSSKSVPSLVSDGGGRITGDMRGGLNSTQPITRSPGHLGEPTSPRYPQNYPTMSMTMQHPVKPPMSSIPHGHGGNMESMQVQHTGAHRSRSIQSLTEQTHRSEMGKPAASVQTLNMHPEEDRFYQNVGYYPPPPPPPSNPANMPVRTYIPYSSSAGNISGSAPFRAPNSNNMLPRGPPPNLNMNSSIPANLNGVILPQHWQRSQYQQQQQPNFSQNLLRQEAKMLEMQDELRRREERAAIMMSKAQQNHPDRSSQRFNVPPTRYMYQGGQQHSNQRIGPPPTAPKPYRPGMDQPIEVPGRPPLPEEYKFSASMGELPRGAFMYQNNKTHPLNLNINPAANPWDREEKEREALRRKEAAKYWRDQQILELESLGANRNAAQEEQLRALRLEKEFQRRAEELNKRDEEDDGGDGDEEEDDRKAMVKRIQEDLERARIQHSTSSTTITGSSGMNGGSSLKDSLIEERARKIEEIRRKKLELEATQVAEERLAREAQKRRDEDLKRQSQLMFAHQQQQQQQQQQQFLSYQSPFRTSFPPKLSSPTIPTHPLESVSPHLLAPPLPKSPPPAFYRTGPPSPQKSPVSPPQSSPSRPKSDKKSVSFNETVDTNELSTPSPVETERVREDPNQFLTEAAAMLSSPRSPDGIGSGTGNTPGVIGAQEVYRDPRWKRMAEQQQQKHTANTPKPEKLTFKEKMKMFAMETGEPETPKDKVKTSKAQREIETPIVANNNNNNNNNNELR